MGSASLPVPGQAFRNRAWQAFQRAIDPLGSPRPLSRLTPGKHPEEATRPPAQLSVLRP